MTSYAFNPIKIRNHKIRTWDKVGFTMTNRKKLNLEPDAAPSDRKKRKRTQTPKVYSLPGGKIRSWRGKRTEGQINTFDHNLIS